MVDILSKAEEVEKTIVWISKPTKKKYGYAIKLTGDPEILIMRVNEIPKDKDTYITTFKDGGKRYQIVEKFSIPSRLGKPLSFRIRKLLAMEI